MIAVSREDSERLIRMLEHCERIEGLRSRFGDDLQSFQNDIDYRDAVCMNIFQIGEISNSLSDDLKKSWKSLPWAQIYGIRNVLAHAYNKIDDEIIWETITIGIPELQQKMKVILGL